VKIIKITVDMSLILSYCSIQEGGLLFGPLTLMANCFMVASSAVWLPEK